MGVTGAHHRPRGPRLADRHVPRRERSGSPRAGRSRHGGPLQPPAADRAYHRLPRRAQGPNRRCGPSRPSTRRSGSTRIERIPSTGEALRRRGCERRTWRSRQPTVFDARRALNRACIDASRSRSSPGRSSGWKGRWGCTDSIGREGPCYECLHGATTAAARALARRAGVLGSVAGIDRYRAGDGGRQGRSWTSVQDPRRADSRPGCASHGVDRTSGCSRSPRCPACGEPTMTATPVTTARRHARARAARPSHLRHRPVQLPLRVLHAARGLRRRATPSWTASQVLSLEEIARLARPVRLPRSAQAPSHRRRAPRAARARDPGSENLACHSRASRTSALPPTARSSASARARALRELPDSPAITVSLDALDDATFKRINDVNFPVVGRSARPSTPRPRPVSLRSRSTWW